MTLFLAIYVGAEVGEWTPSPYLSDTYHSCFLGSHYSNIITLLPIERGPELNQLSFCRPGFAGWVSSYLLMQGTTTSVKDAAFAVSIFWACITAGESSY